MRKSYRCLAAWLMAVLFSFTANAQSITISGTVRNNTSKESVPAVSVGVKGTSKGTYTDANGEFSLKVPKLPVVLVITSSGFENQEVTVSDASKPFDVELKVSFTLDQEVVVAATRTPQRIRESPVTIEAMNSKVLKNIPAPSAYEAIANLRGVDMHTASMTFRTVTTRGFASSGNTRLNQLIDGMDNQAPGLNFAVGSVIGLTDLDVDNVELLSGASSALYGSGGMNGTLLLNSKNPFKFQGMSFNIKQGIMHVDGKQRNPAPYYNWSFRYAHAFNNKFAVKLAAELVKGSDWQANDYRNKSQIGILSTLVGGNRLNDPAYNGINVYGDETSADMAGFSYYVQDQTRRTILAQSGGSLDVVSLLNVYMGAIGNPQSPTNAQLAGFYTFAGFPAFVQAALQSAPVSTAVNNMLPFYVGLKNGYFNGKSVSRTGYEENLLVDYNTINVKMTAGFNWKITDKTEASWNTYFGTGTTVYTGADRYSLRNLKMAQHKLEIKSANWMIRGYTTQENAGDSYNASAVGAFLNETARPSGSWFPLYIGTFSEGRRLNGAAASDFSLHSAARASADATRLIPGTDAYNNALKTIKATPIRKGGALFLDKSDLYAAEGQLNLAEALHFADKVDVLIGASWKQWVMNSQGTIFADTSGNIKISETGAYIQLKKKIFNNRVALTAAGRYDKQTNFTGKFTPRITATFRTSTKRENYIRLSYQSAYRFPTNQNQYISLVTGSGSLIGCLPEFQSYYKLNSTLPGYTAASVLSYRAGTLGDSSRLVVAPYKPVVPETVSSYELGYRGTILKKILIDGYIYYSQYKDFLVSSAVAQSRAGNKFELYSPFSTNNVSYVQNSDAHVNAYGWGIGAEYAFLKKYTIYGNVFSDKLDNVDPGVVTFFNAPKYRVNLGLRADKVCKNFGFNIVMKYQDNNYYEGTFVSGTLPYFTTVDAQISYTPTGTKSIFRIGGTNLGNSYNRTGFGSPYVGGLYYVSYGWNIF